MRIAQYCKQQGMDKNEYKVYKKEVENDIQKTIEQGKKTHNHIGGMYFPASDILELKTERDYFILNGMKNKGVEFINDNTLYRIV